MQHRFIAFNKDNNGGKSFREVGILNRDFFSDIPNHTKQVFGHATGLICYVHEQWGSIHHANAVIPRPGTCLRMVGPTMVPVTLMVAGTFRTNPNTTYSKEILKLAIIVSKSVFNTLTTPIDYISGVTSQVTVQTVDCDFPTNPVLSIFSQDASGLDFMVYNAPSPLLAAMYGEQQAFIRPDGHFFFPFNATAHKVTVMSTNRDVVSFDLTPGATSVVSTVRLPTRTVPACKYTPTTTAYINDTSREMVNFFMWSFYVKDVEPKSVVQADDFVQNFTQPQFVIMARVLTPIAFTRLFTQAEVDLTVLQGGVVPFNSEVMTLKMGSGFVVSTDYSVQCDRQAMKYRVAPRADGATDIFLKVRFLARCTSVGNTFMVKFNATGGATKLRLNRMQFYRTEEEKVCSNTSIDCLGRECTAFDDDHVTDFSELPWDEGCVPMCGTCMTGMYCNSSGFCTHHVMVNTRDAARALGLLLAIVLLVMC